MCFMESAGRFLGGWAQRLCRICDISVMCDLLFDKIDSNFISGSTPHYSSRCCSLICAGLKSVLLSSVSGSGGQDQDTRMQQGFLSDVLVIPR